ncbi:protein ASPARTIC PROTEASE IN GUARD CELL 2-like [Panicum miliaceum]|uniref:Protein ASPARTIC PROTEASE IN GUARD CELL 2-like n=1 Tax=Panicum miliaceum TaxID=4540 RepID=A0A3L6QKD6_PANMI|nr:protein ASPARTIC PROTEASE IN GUARD CELL 2-like [Panicum miliaceum]
MSSSPVARLLLPLLLCAGALGFLSRCHGARAAEAPRYVTVSAASFKPGSTCRDPDPVAPRRNGTSAVLRLTHRHGPCAPARASSLAAPSVADTLRADQRRAEYILRRVSGAGAQQLVGSKAAATVPASWGYDIGTLNYVVTASLGTPGVAQTLEVDTGSDLSWVQCKPCAASSCYSQKDPLFDPARSSSYAAVPCGGSACAGLGLYASGCSAAQCGYVVSYGDGSNTTGVYGSDTLTLTATGAVQGFLFGCGHAQSGLLTGIDGLLGLGRLPVSLVGQTAGAYGGAFSYCLPTKPSTTGYLTLGGAASATAPGFATTQLLTSPGAPTYYIVMLTGISVGGQALSVPASAFAGGTVVDTGTVVTRLPPAAYAALRSAFRSGMTAYPSAAPNGILDTCYDFSGYGAVTLPSVALAFSSGATLTLGADGILSFGCLAFAASGSDGGMAILGNVQQRSFEVRIDGDSVGFRPGAC